MAHDDIDAPDRQGPATGRMLLFGGVAAACLAGGGLGLWARPVGKEQPAAAAKPQPEPVVALSATDRRLHVVVDDAPAPVGKPLDVLPSASPQAKPVAAEPQAVKRPPFGLFRVAAPLLIPTPPAAKPAPASPPVMEAPKPLPVTTIKVPPAPRKPLAAEPVRVARAEHAAPPARKAAPVKLAKAAPKHAKPKAHEVEFADEAPPPAKPRRALLALAHVIERVAQHRSRADDARRDDQEQRADAAPSHGRKASMREVHLTRPEKARAPKIERFVPPLSTKGAGPIKVASVVTRCASPDPGEALACGDPNLVAAQRRLNRAYAEAEAAGVPHATLEQQQQRWLSARAAAAREAPWAVREVYQARIAELQDLARSAEGN